MDQFASTVDQNFRPLTSMIAFRRGRPGRLLFR